MDNIPSRPNGAVNCRNLGFIFEELDRRILNNYLERKICDRYACDYDFLDLTTICCIYLSSSSSRMNERTNELTNM
jgi:hypothetical protein